METNTDLDAALADEPAKSWLQRLQSRLPNWLREYLGLNMTEKERQDFLDDQQIW